MDGFRVVILFFSACCFVAGVSIILLVGISIGKASAHKSFESKEICEYESKAECNQRWVSVNAKSGDEK